MPRPMDEDAIALEARKPATVEEETIAFREYFQRLDARRQDEDRDAEWDRKFADAVASAWQSLQAQHEQFRSSVLFSTGCGRTLCRVEMQHDSKQAAKSSMTPLISAVGAEVGAASAYVDPGTNRTLFYFARAGSDLPSRYDPVWQ